MNKTVALMRMKIGGNWLGACREWIQWNIRGGDEVKWGSEEEVTVTIKQLEEFAADIAEATIKEFCED